MKEHKIVIGDREFTIKHEDLVDDIDITRAVTIDYSNIHGDYYVTTLEQSAIGMYLADIEYEFDMAEVAVKSYEETWKNEQRSLAKEGKRDKVTDTGLAKAYTADETWQDLMQDMYKKKMYLTKIKNLYWKIESKIDKLNNSIREIIPEEFTDEVIERALKKSHIMRLNKERKGKGGLK